MAKRGRQPNMSFFAFTATPKHKTLAIFGRGGEPFHRYTMRQAIEEGRASDVAWTSRTLTDTAYSFSGLMPNTDYQVRVKAVCSGGTTYSSWARYMFHTYCLPQAIGNTQVTYNFDQ